MNSLFRFSSTVITFLCFANFLFAQNLDCAQFHFRVEAMQPTAAQGFSQGRFNVYLATTSTTGLPDELEFDQLTFAGNIGLTFSSSINSAATNNLNGIFAANYAQYLTYDAGTGQVSWDRSNTNINCATNDDPAIKMDLPKGDPEVLLFTIAVDAMPNERIRWADYQGVLFICQSNCNNLSAVSPSDPSSVVLNFPAITNCSFSPPACFSFEYLLANGIQPAGIHLTTNGFPPNLAIRRLQLVVRMTPAMNGIVTLTPNPSWITPGLITKRITNPDGTIDTYLDYQQIGQIPNFLALFEILGQANFSVGGTVNCAIISSKITYRDDVGNIITCEVRCNNQNVIIPGYSLCNPYMVINASVTPQSNCEKQIEFTVDPKSITPVSIDDLTLQFAFSTVGISPAVSAANLVSSDLPCSSCWSTINSNGFLFLTYTYKASQNGGPFIIPDPAKINWLFNFKAGCMRYFVTQAEARLTGQTDLCSINSKTGLNPQDWPICSEQLTGEVVRASLTPNSSGAENHIVQFTDANGLTMLDPNDKCSPAEYAFCINNASLPGQLSVASQNFDPSCGVDLLDVLLMQRHILGLSPLRYWDIIAGDVNRSSGLASSDIVEMRKLILGAYTAFPNVRSWEFFNDEIPITISNPFFDKPWDEQTLDVVSFPLPFNSIFNGIKMGDVNGSCVCFSKPAELPSQTLSVVSRNNAIELNAPNMLGVQAELLISGVASSDVEIEINEALGMDAYSYHFDANSNILKLLWISPDGETPLADSDWLVRIKSKSSEALEITLNESRPQLALATNLEEKQLVLAQTTEKIANALDFQISPQPMSSSATFTFHHAGAGTILLEFGHLSGLRQKKFRFEHSGGTVQYPLDFGDTIPGSYTLKVAFNNLVSHAKLVKQ
jgi:hypothetical protein